jgi:hypothetical protein
MLKRPPPYAAHHREILQEVDHLVLISKVGMKDQRGGNHEDKQEPRTRFYAVPQKERKRTRDLNGNRSYIKQGGHCGHAHERHVVLSPLGIGDFIDA